MTSFAARVASFWACLAAIGCTTDHDLLAEKPPAPGSDGGPTDGASGQDRFPTGPRDSSTTVDVRDPELAGPWALTVMNGVIDTDGVRFCFVPVVDGAEAPPDAPPVPTEGALSFGSQVVLSSLGVDLAANDVHPYLVFDGPATTGLSCRRLLEAAADAGLGAASAPVVSLPIIPANALSETRSYLAVATGCAHDAPPPTSSTTDGAAGDGATGDASSDGPAGAAAADGTAGDSAAIDAPGERAEDGSGAPNTAVTCGPTFGPTSLGLPIVKLSRQTDYAKVGFQVVNASAATTPATLLMEQKSTSASILFADSLGFGQILPRAQPSLVARADFGAPVGSAVVQVAPPLGGAGFAEYDTNLGTILAASHIDEELLSAGTNFAFVLIGAQPTQGGVGARAFTIRLVASAPDFSHD